MYSSAKKSGVGCASASSKRTIALVPTSATRRSGAESATERTRIATRAGLTAAASTPFLSARGGEGLKDEGRGRPRPSSYPIRRALRPGAEAGSGGDVAAGALLRPCLRADGALDAVGDLRRGADDDDVLDALVVRAESGHVHTRVALRVVGVVRLDCGDRGANVRLRGGVVRAVAEAQVGRHRDRQQDAEDDDDDEELDEGETAFLTSQARLQVGNHCDCSFDLDRWSAAYRRAARAGPSPERVIPSPAAGDRGVPRGAFKKAEGRADSPL